MASVVKVSKKQWNKYGLPDTAYEAILAYDYMVTWTVGNKWTILSTTTNKKYGTCKATKKDGKLVLEPDDAFKDAYQSLVGAKISDHLIADQVAKHDYVSEPKPKVNIVSGPKPKAPLSLATADTVGLIVQGTSSPYKVFMISSACNLGYYRKGDAMAVRAEALSPSAEKNLSAWGLTVKKSPEGKTYASVHLTVSNSEVARRTLGSIMASVLETAPKQLLDMTSI